jgi:site-specific DNA-methyltransferase (adenine-specific)
MIICGNCAQVLAGFPADYIDLTVTSPPYDNLRDYNGYEFDFEPIARQLYRVTKPGGVVVWVVADATIDGSETGTSFRQALGFQSLGFNVETMIYEQAGTGAKGCNYLYWQTFEFMFILSKGKIKTSNLILDKKNQWAGAYSHGRATAKFSGTFTRVKVPEYGRRTNIWRYSVGFTNYQNDQSHPAIFPEALARDHIISWSNPGDLVLDPMCGSGTTLKMAKELGRNFIGIDISEEYCQLSQRRVEGARVPLFVPEANGNGAAEPEQLEMDW